MKEQNNKSAEKSGRSWFLVLFALPFAGVGAGLLIWSVIPTLYDWSRMRSWQTEEAVLTQAILLSHQGDDSTTYSVTATYHYTYAGRDFLGSRVAIGSSADNIGSFQQTLGSRLERALQREIPISIWVNPENPAESIIDRNLRVGLLGFKLLFVVMFGGVGFGLLIFQWFYAGNAAPLPAPTNKPWLAHSAWAQNRISCSNKAGMWFAWLFAIFWNLISMPVAFLLPGELAKSNYPILIALLFPLVGLGLLWWAIGLTRDWRRYGEVILTLDPFPGGIGGQVGGTLELNLPYSASHQFVVTINCIYHHQSGSGKNRDAEEKLVWQNDGYAQTKPGAQRTQIQFRFDVPPELPASEPAEMPYHGWRVDIKSTDQPPKFSRQFDIPVYVTGARSRYISSDSASHPAILDRRLEHIEAVWQIP